MFTDRAGGFRKNLESQASLPTKENPTYNTKPTSPGGGDKAGSLQRPMKDQSLMGPSCWVKKWVD